MKIIEINNSETNEINSLVGLLSQQMSDINSARSLKSIEIAIQNALKPESRAWFFLAKQHEIPIGVAFVNICSGIDSGGDYVWINEIQIAPAFRGQRFGKQLLNHVLKWSKENNMKTELGVTDTKNYVSQALFNSADFTIEDIKWMTKK
jgi:GNAT superfamily N-acetyltransferase